MSKARFEVYAAKDGYRWRLLAANNRIIADSGEAYTKAGDANRAVRTMTATVGKLAKR